MQASALSSQVAATTELIDKPAMAMPSKIDFMVIPPVLIMMVLHRAPARG
jgi:hypothetical protein